MSWEIGYDPDWKRDIGYGVPATCDHPDCNEKIDRGLSYVCGDEPYGGEKGCGLHFCHTHLQGCPQRCERCIKRRKPFLAKPDHAEWIEWKLNDKSWKEWRDENPAEVLNMREQLKAVRAATPTTQKEQAHG